MNLVNWCGSLATIVTRTLQSQDDRIRCSVHRNLEFFKLPGHAQFLFIFGQFLQVKSLSGKKCRGRRMSKIVKSTQSCSNGHLPHHSSIHLLSTRARCMTWRVNLRAQYRCAVATGTNVFKVQYLIGFLF